MPRHDKDSELVLGLIATVGTEIGGAINAIRDLLSLFRYVVEEIVVSKNIISLFEDQPRTDWTSEYDRISHYMNLGNEIRWKTKDSSILMKGVARYICLNREIDKNGHRQPRKRTAYIVKSLKHPSEVEFMRDTYGEGFHLIGLTSSYDRRQRYLVERKGLSEDHAKLLLKRDEDEDFKQGQHTRDAFQHADYFVNITEDNDLTYNSLSRLIDLLFGDPFVSPNFDEYAMFMAYSSSLRSADLSRQIGAVITKNNEILSTGANDCAKVGGGLYWPELQQGGKYVDIAGGRDYMCGYDSNKIEQQKIIDALLGAFNIKGTEENINKVKNAGIGDLTEYGRVVHGEMEAILACARNNISCRGATLYATTFPCHNCAKHIIAAGIMRVVYIEPYPKSKTFSFFPVEISDGGKNDNKVIFEPFTGVGPQRFIDLFAVTSTRWYAKKRKDKDGKKLDWKREGAELRNPISLLGYLEAERLALMAFEDEIVALKKGG